MKKTIKAIKGQLTERLPIVQAAELIQLQIISGMCCLDNLFTKKPTVYFAVEAICTTSYQSLKSTIGSVSHQLALTTFHVQHKCFLGLDMTV